LTAGSYRCRLTQQNHASAKLFNIGVGINQETNTLTLAKVFLWKGFDLVGVVKVTFRFNEDKLPVLKKEVAK